ncbi:DUF4349 domain-containing protein [Phenylobacterium sp.]|uniref:DUF4349 domain-containing protein n=1 Tax=Phenylobacterium sp. TaxID=1871053 RepID=UPI00286DDF21|nr:DUF4349 domain-containing protein [Phenylobacterium sp.]
MRVVVFLAASLILSACSQPADRPANFASEEAAQVAPGASADSAEASAPAQAKGGAAPQAPLPVSIPMLAYSYDYAISAPPKAIRALVSRHEAACANAGAAVCQVVGSSVSEAGEDRVSGNLTLRATPAWLKGFREGLGAEAKANGGRLVRAAVESEDLSRQIVDSEAALRARTTLRDRLQGLLASRPGKLSELLEVERELARVQGEIDATQSELTMMRGRVATSQIKLTYESGSVLAPEGAWSPVGRALGDVADILAGTLAAMIRTVAVLAPWALVVGGLLWLFRRRLPRWGRKPKDAPKID